MRWDHSGIPLLFDLHLLSLLPCSCWKKSLKNNTFFFDKIVQPWTSYICVNSLMLPSSIFNCSLLEQFYFHFQISFVNIQHTLLLFETSCYANPMNNLFGTIMIAISNLRKMFTKNTNENQIIIRHFL